MCAPSSTISSGRSRPRSSPTTLALGASGSVRAPSASSTSTGPRAREPRQQVGVLDRDGRGGDLAHAVVVAERAGVRRAQAHRRHRAHENGEGAAPGGLRGGVQPRLHALGVARIVVLLVVGRHAMVDEGDRPVERSPRSSGGRRGCRRRPPARVACRRTDAAAEPEERHGPIDRSNDPGPLRAADPVRDLHRLEMHVVEAVVAHLPDGPRERLVERRRAGDPVADPVGELASGAPTRRPVTRRTLRRSGRLPSWRR